MNFDGKISIIHKFWSKKIQKKYFLEKIADMSENVACRYWIQKAGVKYYNEIMHIAVENMKVK